MKTKRLSVLVELIKEGRVGSHEDARRLLKQRGYLTTQATVSRDLEELNATRIRVGNALRYTLSKESSEFGISVKKVLKDFVVERSSSGNMIVMKTPPGHAAMVAAALDRANISGILGTVAGDDTLFVLCDEKQGGKGVLKLLDRDF